MIPASAGLEGARSNLSLSDKCRINYGFKIGEIKEETKGVSKKMNKIDLARGISERDDVNLRQADQFLISFMELVGEALEKGEKVQLAGFGILSLRFVAARKGRNPKTGESLEVPASYYPNFKAGKGLKDRVASYKSLKTDKVPKEPAAKDRTATKSEKEVPASKNIKPKVPAV